tara:strand:+ start:9061 stop:9324 length:264 start_codon:yes stop_codon:yes gene_type:complete
MALEEHFTKILDSFTQGGTPLPALVGNKIEWQVTTLVAGLLANESVSSTLEATEIVDAAINYANIIQERLAVYQGSQIHTLEKLLEN